MRFCSLLVESCSDGTDERIGSDRIGRRACYYRVNTARRVERLLVGRSVMVLDAQSRRRAAACEAESVSRGRVTSGVVETITERMDGWMGVVWWWWWCAREDAGVGVPPW